ncbi:hypothetical protein HDA40_006118 [Hamadaea flava]|uniref:Uncharacterized protein n=1 Tax=Hamadaea flava TaxID=1742688 RepID=A0ABV8LWA5_9ACTN|nr:hypothetical protein [Hamadaea flava]MCP2327611.1 hypothetical protein [Hamadaea flava]
MSTLPTLPTCGQPATVRIEAYSPRDGLAHGTLDVSVNVCDAHVEPVSATLRQAGFTAHRDGQAQSGKRCGDGYDYTQPGLPSLRAPEPPPAATPPIHFPYGHPWSCGATAGETTSTEKAAVTCGVCRSEMEIFPDREPGLRLDVRGEQLADQVRRFLDSGSWDLFRDAADQLYRHATRRRPGGAR